MPLEFQSLLPPRQGQHLVSLYADKGRVHARLASENELELLRREIDQVNGRMHVGIIHNTGLIGRDVFRQIQDDVIRRRTRLPR